MTTYAELHAGAVILGFDGAPWGVKAIHHEPQFAVTLVRQGWETTGFPSPATEVTVIEPADIRAEAWAAQALIDAFGEVGIISERWES